MALLACSLMSSAIAQTPLTEAEIELNSHFALQAHYRFMEIWNTRDADTWASSLNYPHVRPSSNPRFDLFESAEVYAANTNFNETLATGWRYSRWHSREILQVGENKVHIAGRWIRSMKMTIPPSVASSPT